MASASDAVELTFRDYMARCLYDPEHGYYSAGRVAFGRHEGAHFWTWPQGLGPAFGWMVADLGRRTRAALVDAGHLGRGEGMTILELGAGDGDLARDTCDRLDMLQDPGTRYVIGDRSPALRGRQRARLGPHVDDGPGGPRAAVRAEDARSLSWPEDAPPFRGLVVANELLDTWPSERLRLYSRGDVRRVGVRVEGGDLFDAGARLEEVEASADLGSLDAHLVAHLERIAPLVADLEAVGAPPAELLWPSELPSFVRGLAALCRGGAVAVLLDYGGTSRHVLDSRSGAPHVRVYGPDGDLTHSDRAYDAPGRDDVTVDIDFTAIAHLARAEGLEVGFYGHQSALERGSVDLDSVEVRRALGARHPGADLDHLVERFRRRSPGFQMIALGPPGLPPLLGDSEPIDGEGLATLAAGVTPRDLAPALVGAGLNPGIAVALKPAGDLDADLADRGYAHQAGAVRRVLRQQGWLRAPGELGGEGP